MAKLHELEKYLHYTFSTGCDTGEDYKSFQHNAYNTLQKFYEVFGVEVRRLHRLLFHPIATLYTSLIKNKRTTYHICFSLVLCI